MTSRLRLAWASRLTAIAVVWLALVPGGPAQAGRLASATSPYLLLHADDAIDWHPWGTEALELARRQDKPIFVTVGYASCHWCHVLARTTFVDERVIAALNEHFVSILIDREERPDLDGYFMDIMSAMLGTSGYPAMFLLTPDAVPLFASGYLAPSPEFGRPGFVTIVESLAGEWATGRDAILSDADSIRGQLDDLARPHPTGAARGGQDPRDDAARQLSQAFDETYGGFGARSKFLLPNVLSFLLDYGVRHDDERLRENVIRTLDRMAAGGVRDQLGGAFHRYSVDRFWQVPHFEMTLDANALLASLYLEAYQAFGQPRHAAIARGVLEALLARFRLPGGGFASALDAESEATEGLYYTWTVDEVHSALGADRAAPFIEAYLDPDHGLVRGRSVLRYLGQPDALPKTEELLAEQRSRLRRARAERVAPRRDDKVLTSWNALAASAFAKAAQILDHEPYLRVAQETLDLLLAPLADGRPLPHSRRAGAKSEEVFLDDYAFLIQALLDVYETDFRVDRLDTARTLMAAAIERFQDEAGQPFRLTPVDAESHLPARVVLKEDGAPSGNAAALIALHRLALFGADAAFAEEVQTILPGLGRYLEKSAPLATGLLRALAFRPDEAHEIVIVGYPDDADTRALLREVRRRPLRGTVVAVIAPDVPSENEKWPLLAARPLIDGKPTAYVCRQRLCKLPVNTPRELAAQLDRLVSGAPTP